MLTIGRNEFTHDHYGGKALISRALASIIGAVLFLYGIIAAISPLPLGVILMVVGFLIFAGANPFAEPLLRRMRRRWPWFNALVKQVGKRSKGRFQRVVQNTNPDHKGSADKKYTSSSQYKDQP